MTSSGFLARAHLVPLGLLALYGSFLFAMFTPVLQKHFLFLHKLQFPFFADYDKPEQYGLAPFKTRNLRLTAADGVKIGAWHVLPEEYYQQQMLDSKDGPGSRVPFTDAIFDEALKQYPTVIYLHGNAANRAAPFRIRAYSHLTGRLPVNVVAIDYRGFGDSDGDPTEHGLVSDARAAVDFVRERAGRSDGTGIVVFGQSLGSGVAAFLTRQLVEEGMPPQALVLMAAYSSLSAVVRDFRLLGIVPLLAPLKVIPGSKYLLDKFQVTKFETDRHLAAILSRRSKHLPHIILLHAQDDIVIPVSHSERLWDGIVNRSSHRVGAGEVKEWVMDRFVQARQIQLDAIAPRLSPPHPSGGLREASADGTEAKVSFFRTESGGHDHLTEGAVDLLGRAAGLL